MAAVVIRLADLAPFADIPPAKAQQLIEDAMATAALHAPCILTDDFAHAAAAKAIIREAILRRHEAGTGARQTQQAGPFSATVDTRSKRQGILTADEIGELKGLCSGSRGGAFSIDTAATSRAVAHTDSCDVAFGGGCSCGAVLTQHLPLYGR